jgi:5-methyltetrahydrofolate--homocysteine methyltransferase
MVHQQFHEEGISMTEILTQISNTVIRGQVDGMAEQTQQALDQGIDAKEILNQGLMPGMDHVGVEFKAGNMFVPEVLRSARTMQASMDILKPILSASGVEARGKVLLGTVQGDLHDIGKNLVGMMCEGAGFEVQDLGKNIDAQGFVQGVKEFQPDVLGMSALLTTTMRAMESTIKALQEANLRDQVKIMIGGAPVTQAFAEQIGADGYASNAVAAADLAKRWVAESSPTE